MTMMTVRALLGGLVSFALVACATTAPDDTAQGETTGVVAQALGKDGTMTDSEKRECKNNCIEWIGLPCVNNCPSGPGVTSCINGCLDEEDACKAACDRGVVRTNPGTGSSSGGLGEIGPTRPPTAAGGAGGGGSVMK